MPATIPSRLDLEAEAPRQFGALLRFSKSVDLDPTLARLIEVRASQLNGCAFCLDMHWKDARAAGESEERLYSIVVWRESPLYDERERAALALCEEVTLLADGGVADSVYEEAEAQLGEELPQVLVQIAVINAWNRLMVPVKAEPGHYQPGDFDGGAANGNG